jgi:Kef-type K+ transport system membrane component KefB
VSAAALGDFELSRFFLALVLLLGAAHGVSYALQRLLGFPRVIGEITGGLILGPTGFGLFLPGAQAWVFDAFPTERQLISVIYWIGLVLLMFLSGLEVRQSAGRGDRRLIATILVGATALPFLVGWFAPAVFDFSPYMGPRSNPLSLTLVIAIAISVTSIPVISKIFLDLGIADTRFAKIVLATATIEDVLLWVALAVATGLVSGGTLSVAGIVSKVIVTMLFFVAALRFLPLLLEPFGDARANLLIKSSPTGYAMLVCFLFAAVAGALEVNIIFGAFLAGVVLGATPNDKLAAVKQHIREIGLGFFIPIYFAVVGLKLDLIRHFDAPFFAGFLFVSAAVKALGTAASARLAGQDWLSSANLAVAMNARGGPGIVLATVAFELGIINEGFFTTLVLVAIATSLAAGYWLRFVLSRGWRLLSD